MEDSVISENRCALFPLETFLHRIFPAGLYESDKHRIVSGRIFKPRKDCDEFSLSMPIDWESLEKKSDRNWRMQLQGWAMFHPVMNFFDSYGDKGEIVNYFVDVAKDWSQRYGCDPDDVTTSRMPASYAWYDMSVGFRALVLAFMLNRIKYYDIPLREDDRELLNELVRKHIANLACEKTFSLNNHGIFQIHGLLALLMVSGADRQDEKVHYALRRMEQLIESQFDSHGIHLEHSPHYHFYVLATFSAVVKSGWYANSILIETRIKSAEDSKKWLVDPRKRPVCVGDSILTVQDSVEFPGSFNEENYCVSDFNESGYAVVRSNWQADPEKSSMLFLAAAYHSKSHKHRDCMSFEWFEHGEKIICDGGKYGYRSDKFRSYFLSSRAHNSVEIEGFDILKIKPYGSAIRNIEQLPGNVYRMEAALDYPAIKHFRELYFKPGSWLLVIDDLKFVRARSFTQWFHLEKRFGIRRLANNSVSFFDSAGGQLLVECHSSSVNPVLYYGDENSIQGYVSENDYQYDPAIALGFKGFGKGGTLATTLATSDAAKEDALSFMASELDSLSIDELQIDGIDSSQPILPNVKHRVCMKPADYEHEPGVATTRVYINRVPLTFYSSVNTGNKKLLVMLPGATKRARGEFDFQRYSWADEFDGFDFMSFSDPTIRSDNDLSIGWFQNSEKAFGIDALAIFIKMLIERDYYKAEDIIIFGSSAGGFTGLKLSEQLPLCPVLAINPQLYLYRYSASHFNAMVGYSYANLEREEAVAKYSPTRFVVNLNVPERESPIYIFQNLHDEHHLNRHLKPLIKDYSGMLHESEMNDEAIKSAGLNVIYYQDEKSGHSPPDRNNTVAMIKSVLNVLGEG